jgi:hypothetical protein
MKKIILAIVVLLAAGGFYAYSHLGGAVKSIIESAGTQAMGTKVSVSGLDISLASETASINGLTVANPHGFSGDFLKTKTISATLGGIADKTVTIKEVVVDGMTVTYDIGPGGTNFDVMKRNLKSASSTTPSAKPSPASAASNGSAEKGGYDVIIQQLKIINAQVIPSIGGKSKPVSLPEIVLTNIGSKGNPATPEQVAKQVMDHVLAVSAGAATKFGLSSLPIPAGANMDNAKNTLKGLLSK